MSNFSPEYLQGWKDSVESEQISGDRVSVMTFGLIGGFILGLIMLWTGTKGRRDQAEVNADFIDRAAKAEREAEQLDRQAKAADEALADLKKFGKHEPAPAPKPSDLEKQAG